MWLGLSTIFIFPILGIFASVIRPILDPASVNPERTIWGEVGFALGVFGLILSVSSIATGISAYKKGERSWVLWVGFVPAVLVGGFWIFMIVGEFIFPH